MTPWLCTSALPQLLVHSAAGLSDRTGMEVCFSHTQSYVVFFLKSTAQFHALLSKQNILPRPPLITHTGINMILSAFHVSINLILTNNQ